MKTILLADDSITIQKVVELTFSDGDYRVLCVSNGSQALRKIAEARPDVVLLDVIMPEKNGYEVCEAMKADPATAGIPVLLLTGTFEPFDRQRADAAGAEGHLTKPFESHTLVARVEEMIARGAGRDAAPPPAPRPEPRPEPSAEVPSPMFAAPHPTGGAAASPGPVIEEETPDDARAMPPAAFAPPGDPGPQTGPHPAFAAPDASSGGSYMGFADLAVGEEEVVPDRYDSIGTVRIDRAQASPTPPAAAASPTLEGFVSAFEMPVAAAAEPRADHAREESLGTPPPAGQRDPAPAPPVSGPAGDAAAPALSDQDLDRLADLIVKRMSDRVVREIAWEVIPGVAESLVRQRIREIEGEGR